VKNYVDFLAEDLEGQIQGRAAEDLKHLEVAAQELQEMVQDVLVYSQLGRERNLTPGEIDCRHLIESITSSLSMGSNRRILVEGELPVLHAPAVLVRPIFQNLIENGLKYNRSETPEVRVTAVRLEGQPTVWEFDFHDNGIGIDIRHHEDIFRLFRRLHSGGDFAGTGIGLASVNKAVDLLGGSIRVESSPECGSSFFVQLPERQG
jgi:light-regulated signal transduction histidine kinase (bacteriophytochrome)